MKTIAIIHTDFPTKFGIPRQSTLSDELTGTIVFEPAFRDPQYIKGLEGFSHLWLLWGFSANEGSRPTATVAPPRLGGKERLGVFATRSPFRPNPIGLSCVKLVQIVNENGSGLHLIVSGIDMMDGTPIYDIKPYIPFCDCHLDATGGFTEQTRDYSLNVCFPKELLNLLPDKKRAAALEILKEDPRPAAQRHSDKQFGVAFAGYDIHFIVSDHNLTVTGVDSL